MKESGLHKAPCQPSQGLLLREEALHSRWEISHASFEVKSHQSEVCIHWLAASLSKKDEFSQHKTNQFFSSSVNLFIAKCFLFSFYLFIYVVMKREIVYLKWWLAGTRNKRMIIFWLHPWRKSFRSLPDTLQWHLTAQLLIDGLSLYAFGSHMTPFEKCKELR